MRNIYLILILAAIMLAGCKSKEDSKNKDSRNKEIRKAKSDGLPLQTGEPETAQMTQEKFRKKLVANESFSLTSNLELEGWESVPSYKGKLEGQGKKLTIKSFGSGAVGLIKEIASGGQVKDLSIELEVDLVNSSTAANIYIGVLAGENEGRIEGVKVTGADITTNTYSIQGGLIGINRLYGRVENCFSSIKVINASEGAAGGLIGLNEGGDVIDSHAKELLRESAL